MICTICNLVDDTMEYIMCSIWFFLTQLNVYKANSVSKKDAPKPPIQNGFAIYLSATVATWI